MRSRIFLCLSLFVFFASTGSVESKQKPSFEPPETTQGKDGWELYKTQTVYSKSNVANLKPGQSSPEAALVHFYASLIRKDSAYKQVLPDQSKLKGRDKKRLKSKLDKMSRWTFQKVQLLMRKKISDSKFWIKIEMEIEVNGKTDGGKDEASVELIDGKWFVTSPPT
ncbi:MAG TPA: hypothetical protein VM425_14040 [Myxococcota bacterium]|nr:hypothetical protein [Myxococcota bacterium]